MTKLISQHVPCDETHDNMFPVTRLMIACSLWRDSSITCSLGCPVDQEGREGGREGARGGGDGTNMSSNLATMETAVGYCLDVSLARAKCSVDPHLTGVMSQFRQTQSISVPHTADLLFSLLSLTGSNSFAPHSPTPSPPPIPTIPLPLLCVVTGCADFKFF